MFLGSDFLVRFFGNWIVRNVQYPLEKVSVSLSIVASIKLSLYFHDVFENVTLMFIENSSKSVVCSLSFGFVKVQIGTRQ